MATIDQRLAVLAETNPKAVKLFAVWCARQALVHTDDPRVVNCVDITERYIHGEVSRQTLVDAARAAARAAANAAAYAADAAWAAAYAAWAAANAADAASDAASDAAWAAARAAARQAQEAKLAELEEKSC